MNKRVMRLEELKDSRLLYDKKVPAFGYMSLITIMVLIVIVVIWSMVTPKVYMVKASGVVESVDKNYVMSGYTGEISEIYIEEGSIVDVGDILLVIHSTDIDLQMIQIEEQREAYVIQGAQLQKLVQSIQEDTNLFDAGNPEDTLYYSQYETYKNQVAQKQPDATTYQMYGYSEEQIANELEKGQAAVAEIYYATLQSVESSILEVNLQLESLDAQLTALNEGQGAYSIQATQSGVVHMLSDYQVGMVVQATQTIASISSEQDQYQIEAYVSTTDAPRVELGDRVDIEVLGLTQSIYGTVEGAVTQIDSDVTVQQSEDASSSSSYIKMTITPDTKYLISNQGDKVNLSSGMTVESRIEYDKISYFYYVMEALGVLTR